MMGAAGADAESSSEAAGDAHAVSKHEAKEASGARLRSYGRRQLAADPRPGQRQAKRVTDTQVLRIGYVDLGPTA